MYVGNCRRRDIRDCNFEADLALPLVELDFDGASTIGVAWSGHLGGSRERLDPFPEPRRSC
jgi:hypothetical protein